MGDDYYNPGLTQYNITHMYQTYDVTSMIKPGDNAMGAMLGEGWWSGLLSFGNIWNHFGDRQSLLAKLVITYKDGTSETITTNERTWKYYGNGPVVYSSLDFGEVYDATREAAVAGWTTAAYNDSEWKRAVVVPLEGTTFSGHGRRRPRRRARDAVHVRQAVADRPDRQQRRRVPHAHREERQGSAAQACTSTTWARTSWACRGSPSPTGARAATITLRYLRDALSRSAGVGQERRHDHDGELPRGAEPGRLHDEGRAARPSSRASRRTAIQYVEITGIDQPLPLAAVQGVAISSVRSLTADYKTSSEKVNRLWSNLVWSNVDNFLTIPTDCPQRNERMGWSGDINVFSRTATYVSNANQFLTRHMYAMRDVQTPAGRFTDVAPVGGGFGGVLWGSAGIVVPWEAYLQYKDVGLLERHYPAMAAYMAYLETTIDPKTGLSSDGQLGDWLGPQNNALGSAFLVTAYHAYDLGIMAKVAEILGQARRRREVPRPVREAQGVLQRHLRERRKEDPRDRRRAAAADAGQRRPGRPSSAWPTPRRPMPCRWPWGCSTAKTRRRWSRTSPTPSRARTRTTAACVRPKYSLMTGFIGTAWISKALSENGHSELAYRLLHNNQYPSWLYAIDQGATSIWERLNGYTVENGFGGNNSMNSFNHYSFGAVGQWMMAYSLGIEREEPGFRTFILQPEPDPTGT